MSDREKRKPFIQMRDDLRTCKEVRQIAAILGKSKNEVVGACYGVWEFANRQLGAVSDRVNYMSAADIDVEAQIPGFAAAMVEAGWLVIGPTWVEFPEYNEAIGSRAHHEQAARDRLAGANARKAAIQAEKERMRGPSLFDQVPSAEPEPPDEDPEPDPVEDIFHEPLVTSVVTRANGNGNGNSKEKPPFVPPGGEGGKARAAPAPIPERPPRMRELEAQRKLDGLAALVAEGPLAVPWREWLTVCVDKGNLPANAQAAAIVRRLREIGQARACTFLRDWIGRGRYTPTENFWTSSGSAAPSGPPPDLPGMRGKWRDERGRWRATAQDGTELIAGEGRWRPLALI